MTAFLLGWPLLVCAWVKKLVSAQISLLVSAFLNVMNMRWMCSPKLLW